MIILLTAGEGRHFQIDGAIDLKENSNADNPAATIIDIVFMTVILILDVNDNFSFGCSLFL
jgi:hypothetical protein